MRRSGWRRAWSAMGVVVAMTGGVLLSGCTGERSAETPSTAPATSPAAPTASTTPRTSPAPLHIEFKFRRPDPLCPSVSALDALPLADRRPYELANTFSYSDTEIERFGHHSGLCAYQRAEIGEGEDMILEDHARISAQMRLYRRWEDSARVDLYRELPVQSADIKDWRVAMGFRRERVGWEGCGEGIQCAEGEEPTIRTLALHVDFTGHVGNLEFDVTVSYIAQRLPADVERRTLAIFRDFVLAAMESYERAD